MRYHSLDALRASMMLLGIWLHSATAYAHPEGIWWYKDSQLSHSMDVFALFLHVFRLPVFFAMSGFFSALLLEKRSVADFLRNRVQRVALPMLAGVALIYPVLRVVSDLMKHRPPSWDRIVHYVEPTHFWFLETLFLTCLVAIPFRHWLTRLPFPSSPLPYAAISFLTLLPTEHGILDTPHAFVPEWTVQLAYAVFFAGGWAMYNSRDRLGELVAPANARLWLGAAFAAGSTGLMVWKLIAGVNWRYAIAACGALSVWCFILGLTGFFVKYFSQEDRRLRYLADSAYWVYLVHPVALLLVQGSLASLNWPAELKFLLGPLLAIPMLLLVYDLAVRDSFVGEFLNGHRWPSLLWPRLANRLAPEREWV